MIGDADDVAGIGLLGQLAIARQEQKGRMDRDRLAGADLGELHAAAEAARAQPHERDAIAMLRVHVRLHLEDEAGNLVLVGLDRTGIGRLRARRRGEAGKRVDQLLDPEILERRSEIDRGLIAGAIGGAVECAIAGHGELGLLAQ